MAAGALATAAILLIWIYGLFDVVAAEEGAMRSLNRAAWILIVLFLSVLGVAAWFVWGRPSGLSPVPGAGPRGVHPSRQRRPVSSLEPPRPRAPDDDPEFLARLGRSIPPPVPPGPPPDGPGPDDPGDHDV